MRRRLVSLYEVVGKWLVFCLDNEYGFGNTYAVYLTHVLNVNVRLALLTCRVRVRVRVRLLKSSPG